MTAERSPYSRMAIILHWVIALLLIGNITGGLLLDTFLDSEDPAMKKLGFQIIQLHKSFGLTVLLLTVLRLGMRVSAGFPPLPSHMTGLERLLARVTHYGFYALLLLIPLSGWVMVSASTLGFPTSYFGLFTWPHLPIPTSKETAGAASEVHEILAFAAIGLAVLHITGALKHHFFDRDDVLARMIPALRRTAP